MMLNLTEPAPQRSARRITSCTWATLPHERHDDLWGEAHGDQVAHGLLHPFEGSRHAAHPVVRLGIGAIQAHGDKGLRRLGDLGGELRRAEHAVGLDGEAEALAADDL